MQSFFLPAAFWIVLSKNGKAKACPRVYARASHLLSLMTGGTWVEIRMKDDGRLVAVDVSRGEKGPRFLSMGTCQQLYLALRIALLECVEGVGTPCPCSQMIYS